MRRKPPSNGNLAVFLSFCFVLFFVFGGSIAYEISIVFVIVEESMGSFIPIRQQVDKEKGGEENNPIWPNDSDVQNGNGSHQKLVICRKLETGDCQLIWQITE